jgi:inorganic triphosphatase YgiF
VQDWTPVQVLKETLARTRTDEQVAQQREQLARVEAAQESQSVTESLALFYELTPDHQQALLGRFRQANPQWSKYELNSKVLQHVLAKWLRQTEWEPPGAEWLHKDRGSPGELVLKQ